MSLSFPSAWTIQGQPSFCRFPETIRTSTPGSGVPTEPAGRGHGRRDGRLGSEAGQPTPTCPDPTPRTKDDGAPTSPVRTGPSHLTSRAHRERGPRKEGTASAGHAGQHPVLPMPQRAFRSPAEGPPAPRAGYRGSSASHQCLAGGLGHRWPQFAPSRDWSGPVQSRSKRNGRQREGGSSGPQGRGEAPAPWLA